MVEELRRWYADKEKENMGKSQGEPGIQPHEEDDNGNLSRIVLVPAPIVEELPEPDVIPSFIRDLEAENLTVRRVGAYVTRPTVGEGKELTPERRKALHALRDGEVDLVAFSSTAEITALLKAITRSELEQSTKIGCFGPITAGNAKELGLDVVVISKDFSSFRGYAKAITDFFAR
mmetsp:Transcript_25589/g.71700  ORF Transcript_25589/g.71700 Transcript_25589/m.71700 type:complete len:176 (+) Transcript_25589:412-939(+)